MRNVGLPPGGRFTSDDAAIRDRESKEDANSRCHDSQTFFLWKTENLFASSARPPSLRMLGELLYCA